MSFNIEVESGKTVRLPTAGKYCDRDIVVTAKGESITYPVADKPETIGQMACLARAAQMRDIQWTLQGDLTMTGGEVYEKGRVVTGLPYSSVRKTDRFVGFNISLYTFMTAVHNPRSLLYTTTADQNTAENGSIANLYYGVNCSVLGSYAHDWNYHSATNTIPELPYIEEINPADMKLCDLPNASLSHGGSTGHCTVVTGITRNEDGSINSLEITESWYPLARTQTMTYDQFVANFINGQGYKVYRDQRLYEAGYKPSPFVQVFEEEPIENIVYSNLCTNRGDKVTITTEESIILNVLISSGYESILVYKDGTPFGTYTVSNGHIVNGDLELSDLTPGIYTAVLCDADGNALDNAGTSFEVCEVTASRYGNRFYFKGADGIPVRVVFKDGGGYTLAVYDLSEDDIARGYITISDYAGTTPVQVCVPFKTMYGFVVARFDYSVQTEPDAPLPPGEASKLPDGYQQVEYIETSGNQYIDTAVNASNYQDPVTYDMDCVVTGRADSGKVDYYWGATDGTNRSGYLGLYSSGTSISLYVGTTGDIIKDGAVTFGEDVHFKVVASAKYASSATAHRNGSAFTSKNTGTNGTQPNKNIWLFACNGISDASGNRRFKGKLYSFKMTDANGALIRDFVPCYRTSDNIIGLYDLVGGAFYTNAGGGSFTKGADV